MPDIRIRMTHNRQAPGGQLYINGQEYEIDDAAGQQLINAGQAVLVRGLAADQRPLMVGPGAGDNVLTAGQVALVRNSRNVYDIQQSSIGTILTDWNGATLVTPALTSITTNDLAPVRSDRSARLIGDPSTRPSISSAAFTPFATTAMGLRGIAFWAKCKGRSQSNTSTQVFLGNGADPYTGKALACTIAIPSDGRWYLMFIASSTFSVQNGFVLGTDTIQSIGIRDRHDGGGTLGVSGMLTSSEELQLGPVYLNPWSRPKFLIRMDDSLKQFIQGTITFSADGVSRAWSHREILDRYGFGSKGSIYHLTRRIGTSNAQQEFLTRSDLDTLAKLGWSHCSQTHQDPINAANRGVRLMGPEGFAPRTVASVDTSADTITCAANHDIHQGATYWGYPVLFTGTDLPAPLQTNTVYWARATSATAFQLHLTENDSIANVNRIDLTTTGIPANFTWRYGFSANDMSLVTADLANCINNLTAWGYGKTAKVWGPNQGGISYQVWEACRPLGVELLHMIGYTGTSFDRPAVRHPHMVTAGAGGNTGDNSILFPGRVLPTAIQTDGSNTTTQIRTYVDAVIANGGIGSNYHHLITGQSSADQFCAYLDQLRLRVREGVCDVVTAEELLDYLSTARQVCVGLSLP